jgi:tetratricopeptide (TPR) repeat protein
MPQVRTYKKGSVIYFDGESKNNFAFLLKSGVLTRTKLSPESVQPERTKLVVGEFFGIKAALGILPRDETIQVATDGVVFLFTPKEFEDVIKKNVSIIFKMLKAFSNELRRIHMAIENFMHTDGDAGGGDSASGLFGIGQYYFNQKSYAHSLYAFEKYLKHFSGGPDAEEAKSQIALIKEIQSDKAAAMAAKAEEAESEMVFDDVPAAKAPETKTKSKVPDFLLFESPESFEPEAGDTPVHKSFSEIAFIYSKKEWVKVDPLLEKLITVVKAPVPQDPLSEKIFLARARVKFYLKKYEEASTLAKEFVKSFKGSKFSLFAMAIVAECYAAQDQLDHAKAVFQKIASSSSDPSLADLKNDVEARLQTL